MPLPVQYFPQGRPTTVTLMIPVLKHSYFIGQHDNTLLYVHEL